MKKLSHVSTFQDNVDYRYGFQGQEMDDELKGEGNSANYKYRMHDPRIGRFFAIDPLAPEYPELTPYQFSSNNPIWFVEIEGLEGEPFQAGTGVGGTTIYHDPGTCPTPLLDYDKNGYIGDASTGAEYTDANGSKNIEGQALSFVFKGSKYTANFDSKGKFKHYASGSSIYQYTNASITNYYEISFDAYTGRDKDGHIAVQFDKSKSVEKFIKSEFTNDGLSNSEISIEVSYIENFSPWQKFYGIFNVDAPMDEWNDAWTAAYNIAQYNTENSCSWCTDMKAAAYGMSAGVGITAMNLRFKVVSKAYVGSIATVDDIIANPSLLYGKSADQIQTSLVRSGWTRAKYGDTGSGWKFTKGDQMIFYNTNGSHKGTYWGISKGGKNGGRTKFVDENYVPTANDKAKVLRVY